MAEFEGLGAAIKLLRVERGKTQSELAEQAGIGRSLMSRYEAGITRPTLESVDKVLAALHCGMPELTEALQRVRRHSDEPGSGQEQRRDLSIRSRSGALPKAFLVFDLSEDLYGIDTDGLENAVRGFRSMLSTLSQGPSMDRRARDSEQEDERRERASSA